ncbi:MAG: hypothetical protein LCH30_05070 [Proteobacteria bacterium]|nr:hypothetical protein [Pseudomonadota bacterium]
MNYHNNVSEKKNTNTSIYANKLFIENEDVQGIKLELLKNKLIELEFEIVQEKLYANYILDINISKGKKINNLQVTSKSQEDFEDITIIRVQLVNMAMLNKEKVLIFYIKHNKLLEAELSKILKTFIPLIFQNVISSSLNGA